MAAASARALAAEMKDMMKDPVEGVTVSLVDDDNLYVWEVCLFGPPDSIYTGAYFKAHLEFPPSYPFDPPKMTFVDPIWHPNVYYQSGVVCISILHPPGEDEQSGERPEERWNPSQRVRTIVLSVISLLNEPNISSPANVDASVEYRKWKEGQEDAYLTRVSAEVERSKAVAAADGVEVPTTVEQYCIKTVVVEKPDSMDWTLDDDFDEDDFATDPESDDEDEDEAGGAGGEDDEDGERIGADDSGNE